MKLSFGDVINESQEFVLSPGCSTEIRGFYADGRVDKKTVPHGWNVYEIRTGDNGSGKFCTVEKRVLVNFGGSFLTKQTVKFNKSGCHCLCGRGGYAIA